MVNLSCPWLSFIPTLLYIGIFIFVREKYSWILFLQKWMFSRRVHTSPTFSFVLLFWFESFGRLKKNFFSPKSFWSILSISFSGFWHLRKLHLGQWVSAAEKNLLECRFDLAWPLSASSCQRSPSTQSWGVGQSPNKWICVKSNFLKVFAWTSRRSATVVFSPLSVQGVSRRGCGNDPSGVFKKVPAFTCLLPQVTAEPWLSATWWVFTELSFAPS